MFGENKSLQKPSWNGLAVNCHEYIAHTLSLIGFYHILCKCTHHISLTPRGILFCMGKIVWFVSFSGWVNMILQLHPWAAIHFASVSRAMRSEDTKSVRCYQVEPSNTGEGEVVIYCNHGGWIFLMGLKQGSFNVTHFGGIKQYKYMVILFGLVI